MNQRYLLRTSIIFLTFVLIATGSVLALPGDYDLQYASSCYWGAFADIEASGDYLYVAQNYGITVFDISVSDTIIEVGSLDFEGRNCQIMEISGNYIYVANADTIELVDISTPASPEFAGSIIMPASVNDLGVTSNRLYAALADSTIRIYDITSPLSASQLGLHDTTLAYNYLYVAGDVLTTFCNGAYKISLFDVSNPALPTFESNITCYEAYDNVKIWGDYLLCGDYDMFYAYDISDLSSPALVDQDYYMERINDIVVSGDTAYVISEMDMGIYDLNSVLSLSTIGTGYLNGLPSKGLVVGQNLYLISDYDAMSFYDISDPTSVSLVMDLNNNRYIQDVCKSGDYLYVADYLNGLLVCDVSNPSHPVEIGFDTTYKQCNRVVASGDYAYTASTTYGLCIYDITNPASPTLVGRNDTQGYAYAVEVVDTLAYVADGSYGLKIINVADPTDPTLLGSYDSTGWNDVSRDLVVDGNYAYVAAGSNGMQVIDISDPTAPFLVGIRSGVGYIYNICKSGVYAYVSTTLAGINVLSVATPSNPYSVGSYAQNSPQDMECIGDYLYCGVSGDGMKILNISNKTSPALAAQYNTPGRCTYAAIDDSIAYLADESGVAVVSLYGALLDVGNTSNDIRPTEYHLSQNYPNPFNPTTRFEYYLPRLSPVSVDIFNILGQKVVNLVNDNQPAGKYTIEWNGVDQNSKQIASGIYFYRIETSDFTETRKMVLLK